MNVGKRRLLMTVSMGWLTYACSGSDTPSAPAAAAVTPQCVSGCGDADPFPNSPGVYLSSAVTPFTCGSANYSDSDQDGLADICENSIPAAFAPELYYYSFDEVGREPHWVARKFGSEDADSVQIAYLESYYRDTGSQTYGCSLPFHPSSCDGHNGDSEAIFLTVHYDYDNQHWVLSSAKYSQHESYGIYARGAGSYPTQLYYPSHPGAYPRAYVAQGKHGNYNSVSDCNSGGTLGSDDCTNVNTAARLPGGGQLNLGSRAHHTSAQDCMPSADPSYIYYGSGRLECYWTTENFRGWIPTSVGGADSDPYSTRLQAEGF
jgi:hypothetical protein